MEVKKGYDYDDVLLVPKPTRMDSRLQVRVVDENGRLPIFISPMKGIAGEELLRAGLYANIYGLLHRFLPIENRMQIVYNFFKGQYYSSVGIAVGLGEQELQFAKYAFDLGCKLVCVDVANGYLEKVADFVWELKEYGYKNIMAGNVVTREGADILAESGANFIRVGIGGGNLCTTRNVTGVGSPQLSAIADVNLSFRRDDFYIVSDGGVHNSGNAVKSFAVGADYVMVGSLFGQAMEADHDGEIYGMASSRLQEEHHKEIKSVEGITQKVIKNRPLQEIVDEFVWGIRSACTYLNSPSYQDIQYNAEFISTGNGTLK